jgi:hypothetical protein
VPQPAGAKELTSEEVPFLRFDPVAPELFDCWRTDLEQRLRADHPVLLSHLAEYRSLMPSFASILRSIDGVDAGVGGPCLAWRSARRPGSRISVRMRGGCTRR